ncbi:MAG: pentapeptide repeat-containing protein [Leptolyngbyaceae cyanobacterium CRU_2_3]|nr:pentapeptide repeat-containing protein [Leptolyngbyaceae cyanobacterium CRU_2_3]
MILSFLLSAILSFVAVFLNALFVGFFWSDSFIKDSSGHVYSENYLFGIILILLIAITFFVIARQGLTIRAAGTIACVMALSITFLVALLILGTLLGGNGSEASTLFVLIVAFASVGAVAVAGACTVAGGNRGAVAGGVAGGVLVLFLFADTDIVDAVTFAVLLLNLLLSLYVAWRANKGDEKFALVRAFGMVLGALGGTSFCGADLTAANFTGARVKSANFKSTKQKPTILTDVFW